MGRVRHGAVRKIVAFRRRGRHRRTPTVQLERRPDLAGPAAVPHLAGGRGASRRAALTPSLRPSMLLSFERPVPSRSALVPIVWAQRLLGGP